MISNARPPIGTGNPRARSSRRARSTSHSSNSYTNRRSCARTRGPCSGYLTFHQNLSVRKPPGPVTLLAGTLASSPVEVADAVSQGLSLFSEIFRTASRNCSAMPDRTSFWHRISHRYPSARWTFLPSNSESLSNQEELRVRQADGVANDRSCTETPASQSPRGSSDRRGNRRTRYCCQRPDRHRKRRDGDRCVWSHRGRLLAERSAIGGESLTHVRGRRPTDLGRRRRDSGPDRKGRPGPAHQRLLRLQPLRGHSPRARPHGQAWDQAQLIYDRQGGGNLARPPPGHRTTRTPVCAV